MMKKRKLPIIMLISMLLVSSSVVTTTFAATTSPVKSITAVANATYQVPIGYAITESEGSDLYAATAANMLSYFQGGHYLTADLIKQELMNSISNGTYFAALDVFDGSYTNATLDSQVIYYINAYSSYPKGISLDVIETELSHGRPVDLTFKYQDPNDSKNVDYRHVMVYAYSELTSQSGYLTFFDPVYGAEAILVNSTGNFSYTINNKTYTAQYMQMPVRY